MSGRGGVGSRARLLLARYPAVPASLAGCRSPVRGPGLARLAGAREPAVQAPPGASVGEEGWAEEEIRALWFGLPLCESSILVAAGSPLGLAQPDSALLLCLEAVAEPRGCCRRRRLRRRCC